MGDAAHPCATCRRSVRRRRGGRLPWNNRRSPVVGKRPQLIVRCADVADVIAANFGRDNVLPIVIRGGGHNGQGLGGVDEGLVIDLSTMKGVRVDPKN